jgi:hypothetical protein
VFYAILELIIIEFITKPGHLKKKTFGIAGEIVGYF